MTIAFLVVVGGVAVVLTGTIAAAVAISKMSIYMEGD